MAIGGTAKQLGRPQLWHVEPSHLQSIHDAERSGVLHGVPGVGLVCGEGLLGDDADKGVEKSIRSQQSSFPIVVDNGIPRIDTLEKEVVASFS